MTIAMCKPKMPGRHRIPVSQTFIANTGKIAWTITFNIAANQRFETPTQSYTGQELCG
jgi:hypothetical protein